MSVERIEIFRMDRYPQRCEWAEEDVVDGDSEYVVHLQEAEEEDGHKVDLPGPDVDVVAVSGVFVDGTLVQATLNQSYSPTHLVYGQTIVRIDETDEFTVDNNDMLRVGEVPTEEFSP